MVPSQVVLAISIVVQFLAAGLALRLIGITGRRLAWSLIAAAVTLMGIRRIASLLRSCSQGSRPNPIEPETIPAGPS